MPKNSLGLVGAAVCVRGDMMLLNSLYAYLCRLFRGHMNENEKMHTAKMKPRGQQNKEGQAGK
jgi:hypothetical protein